jgi:hypothetical protein
MQPGDRAARGRRARGARPRALAAKEIAMARRDRRQPDDRRQAATSRRRPGATGDRRTAPGPVPEDLPPVRGVGEEAAAGERGYEREFYGDSEGGGAGAGAHRYAELRDSYLAGSQEGARYGGEREERDFSGQVRPRRDAPAERDGRRSADGRERIAGAPPAWAGRERGDARGDDFRERAGWGQGDYGYGAAHFTRTGFGFDSAGTNFAAYGQPGGFRRPSFAGRGPRGFRRSDERLSEEICERLMRHPGIDPSDVAVRVAGAEVTLEGTVHDRGQKLAIEDLVDSVMGVVEIHNELRVRPGSGADLRADREPAPETGAAPAGARRGRRGAAPRGRRG